MKHILGFGLPAVMLAVGSSAHAACEKDTDCKGDRICVDGVCTSPATTAAPQAVPQVVPEAPAPQAPPQENTAAACRGGLDEDGDGLVDCADPECGAFIGCAAGATSMVPVAPNNTPVDPGWSRGGAITGLIMAPLTLGLFVSSAVTRGQIEGPLPAAPLGGIGLLFHIVGGAITGAGALSAHGVRHNAGLLITGWVFYGVTTVYVAAIFAAGIGLGEPPHPAIIGVGGLLSLTAFGALAADALIVSKRAREARSAPATAKRSSHIAAYPVLTPVVSHYQTVGITGGVGMMF